LCPLLPYRYGAVRIANLCDKAGILALGAAHVGDEFQYLVDRSSSVLVERFADLRASVNAVKGAHPFDTLAWVVLPDHLHVVWRLPEDDADFPTRWMLIKAGLFRRIPRTERIRDSRRRKGERGILQRRYWEHLVRDERDLRRHVDYIHFNPVKHG
jgi:putative transposase